MTRFLKFFRSLLNNPSKEVSVLSRLASSDLRTNIGSNLAHIESETGLNPWLYGGQRMLDSLVMYNRTAAPESDWWRGGYLDRLLSQRMMSYYEGSDVMQINRLILSLVSS